ncbi:restriction endonuclease subunit S [Neisseria elongata]|uniref:restriction endonuclease subunit S n=1 Tax=Neisseria elongata TaxID=495 RepID=UPI00131C3926|nr:restriction endonuclease subunit S [Neisseria elongata]
MTTEQQLLKGWEANFLKLLCTIKTGDKDVNQGSENGKYPFFTCAQEISNSETFSFEGEAILIAGNGNFNVKFYHGRFEAYQRTYVLQNFKNVDAKYLFYFINNKLGDITKGNRGSTIKYIRLGDIANYPIIYPTSKETQQAIVNKIESLFDEIDEGIGRLKTAAQQIQQYRQSLLKNAFNGELTKEWRSKHADTLPSENELLAQIQTTREQHHAQQLADWQTAVSQWEQNGKEGKKPSKPKAPTQAVKFEENFADLPSGWIWGKLSDLGELARGKSKHRPRNDKKLFGGKYPFIQTGEVRAANRIIKKYEQTYSEFGLEQSKLWQKGTLCITIAANIAETAFLGFDACFPDSIVGFSASKAVLPEYIELFIKSARTKIESYAPATAQKNINLNTLENLIVPYCSLTEQNQIVAILENKLTACDQLADELAKQLKQAELLKQAVLKAAFSGSLLDK